MPSVVENQVRWTEHPWALEGHEWSPGATAAGGDMLWWRALLPRIHAHLPAKRVLEIGPGFGRWTSHLVDHAERLIVVDLTERCIAHCQRRFAERTNLEYWTNDGQSLEMVQDESLDFVFSFDSLVHAEASVLRGYVLQLARKLKRGGRAFIHHSNLGALADRHGAIPSWVARKNWRGETMSARLFREFCREAGLVCVTQELINWVSRSQRADRHRIHGSGMPLTDAMSTLVRADGEPARLTQVHVNPSFVHEWRQCVLLAQAYGRSAMMDTAQARDGMATPGAPDQMQTGTVLARTREWLHRRADDATSLARERLVAHRVRRKEPVVNALRAGRCPDCGRELTPPRVCISCNTTYRLDSPR